MSHYIRNNLEFYSDNIEVTPNYLELVRNAFKDNFITKQEYELLIDKVIEKSDFDNVKSIFMAIPEEFRTTKRCIDCVLKDAEVLLDISTQFQNDIQKQNYIEIAEKASQSSNFWNGYNVFLAIPKDCRTNEIYKNALENLSLRIFLKETNDWDYEYNQLAQEAITKDLKNLQYLDAELINKDTFSTVMSLLKKNNINLEDISISNFSKIQERVIDNLDIINKGIDTQIDTQIDDKIGVSL